MRVRGNCEMAAAFRNEEVLKSHIALRRFSASATRQEEDQRVSDLKSGIWFEIKTGENFHHLHTADIPR